MSPSNLPNPHTLLAQKWSELLLNYTAEENNPEQLNQWCSYVVQEWLKLLGDASLPIQRVKEWGSHLAHLTSARPEVLAQTQILFLNHFYPPAEHHPTLQLQLNQLLSQFTQGYFEAILLFQMTNHLTITAEHLRQFIEFAPIPILLSTLDQQTLYANREFTHCFGYTTTEIPTISAWDNLAYPDFTHRQDVITRWSKQMAEAGNQELLVKQQEELVCCKDGSQKVIVFDLIRIGNYYLLTGYDLTAYRQMELALRESEEQYRSVVKAMQEGIVIHNSDGSIFSFNQAAAQILGLTADQLMGRTSFDPRWRAIHEDGTPFPGENHPAMITLRTGEAQTNVIMGVHKPDQTLSWISINSQPIFRHPQDKIPTSVVASFADITKQWQAQHILQESEERFRTTFELAGVGIAHTTLDGRYLWVNNQYCQMVGYSAAELAQRTYMDITHPEDLTLDTSYADELIAGRLKNYTLEKRYIHKNGSIVWGNLTISLVHSSYTPPQYFIAVLEEITERKLAEEALRQTQKLESLGVLAGGIAHDFNNLLTAMMAETSLALLKLPAEHPAGRYLQKSLRVVERASDLTKQLLAYSGKEKFEKTTLELNRVIEDNISLLEAMLPKTVLLEPSLMSHLPTIEGRAGQIQQVVMNLIINAAESYDGQNGVVYVVTDTFRINTPQPIPSSNRLLSPGLYVRLLVMDEGKGMDVETLNKIFNPFFTTKSTGRGLGLSAVQTIVQDSRGAIWATSQPGRGTIFNVLFPAVEQLLPTLDTIPEQPLYAGPAQVLLVDDDQTIRQAIQEILNLSQYEVWEASNGNEALDLFQQHRQTISLVITDVTMPLMSGKELVRELHRHRPGLPVLLLSGYGEQILEDELFHTPHIGFLTKPFSLNQLLHEINKLLTQAIPN